MADESYNFTTARTRLEEIVTQVRKKDTSLEKSLDLLEEGVRLANACTELIDRADWAAAGAGSAEGAEGVEQVEERVEAFIGEAEAQIAEFDAEASETGEEGGAEEADAADADEPVGEDSALEYDPGPDEDTA